MWKRNDSVCSKEIQNACLAGLRLWGPWDEHNEFLGPATDRPQGPIVEKERNMKLVCVHLVVSNTIHTIFDTRSPTQNPLPVGHSMLILSIYEIYR